MTFGFLEEITGYSVCERCIVACSAVESIDIHVASLDTQITCLPLNRFCLLYSCTGRPTQF